MRTFIVVSMIASAALLLSGCGYFTNTSVLSRELAATTLQTVDPSDPDASDFGIRLVRIDDDNSAAISVDGDPEPVKLTIDQWIDLPLNAGTTMRRVKLLKVSTVPAKAVLMYEEGYKSGPPVLRHL